MNPSKLLQVAAALFALALLSVTPATATPGVYRNAKGRMTHGPIVGGVTATSAVVWSRTDRAADVAVRYSFKSDLADAITTTAQSTTANADFTSKVELTGLKSSTVYYFDILVNGTSQTTSPYPSFKTFPPAGQSVGSKFVYLTDFCCDGVYPIPPVNTFLNANNEHPDWVFIGGDFDHRDPAGTSFTDAINRKRAMFKDLYTPKDNWYDFFTLLKQYPVAHQWDDHDSGSNDDDKNYPYYGASLQVLNEYFPTYAMTQYGDWQKFSYGQADFFLLDSRSQRDPKGDADNQNKSMLDGNNLGDRGQLSWLETGLVNSTATWKFILSPVVFNPTLPKRDSWYGYQTERKDLVNYIKNNGVKNVIVLSGDIHAGAIDNGTNSSFPEMAVPAANIDVPGNPNSCITNPGSAGSWTEGHYGTNNDSQPCPGYGVVTVLTNPDRVLLQVKDDEGTLQVTYTVPDGR